MKIRKAVFPVAGIGSRFLPATKANPKEMLPVVDKPLIQYAVEEAIYAGITDMIFVTSSSKRAIEDHFDKNFELEAILAQQQKWDLLEQIRNILPEKINCIYIRQPEPLGLGDAVLRARSLIDDEYFAVILADDLFSNNCMKQLVSAFPNQKPANMIAVEMVAKEKISQYGIVAGTAIENGLLDLHKILEKPQPEVAPSNLGVAGRYILSARIFSCLEQCQRDHRGEIQLTDAIALLLKQEKVYAYPFSGKRYDCGSKLGYLQATIDIALRHPDLAQSFKHYLSSYLSEKITDLD